MNSLMMSNSDDSQSASALLPLLLELLGKGKYQGFGLPSALRRNNNSIGDLIDIIIGDGGGGEGGGGGGGGGGGCVTADFVVCLDGGEACAFRELRLGDALTTAHGIGHVEGLYFVGNQPCLEIITDFSTWAPVSESHKVVTDKGEIEVGKVSVGDRILCANDRSATVMAIRKVGMMPCYNMTVEPYHEYLGIDGTRHCNMAKSRFKSGYRYGVGSGPTIGIKPVHDPG